MSEYFSAVAELLTARRGTVTRRWAPVGARRMAGACRTEPGTRVSRLGGPFGYAGQQAGRLFGSPAAIFSTAARASSKVAILIAWSPSGTAPWTSLQLSAGARK